MTDKTVFRHKKTGGLYELLAIGQMQARNWLEDVRKGGYTVQYKPVDMAEVVIYQSLTDKKVWVRPINEFNERFETVEYIDTEEKLIDLHGNPTEHFPFPVGDLTKIVRISDV